MVNPWISNANAANPGKSNDGSVARSTFFSSQFEFYYVHPTCSSSVIDCPNMSERFDCHSSLVPLLPMSNVRSENCNFAWFMWCCISTLITQPTQKLEMPQLSECYTEIVQLFLSVALANPSTRSNLIHTIRKAVIRVHLSSASQHAAFYVSAELLAIHSRWDFNGFLSAPFKNLLIIYVCRVGFVCSPSSTPAHPSANIS